MQEITQLPEWFDGKKVNEILFCQEFLAEHPMVCVKGTFFMVDKRITDERELKKLVVDQLFQLALVGDALVHRKEGSLHADHRVLCQKLLTEQDLVDLLPVKPLRQLCYFLHLFHLFSK